MSLSLNKYLLGDMLDILAVLCNGVSLVTI